MSIECEAIVGSTNLSQPQNVKENGQTNLYGFSEQPCIEQLQEELAHTQGESVEARVEHDFWKAAAFFAERKGVTACGQTEVKDRASTI